MVSRPLSFLASLFVVICLSGCAEPGEILEGYNPLTGEYISVSYSNGKISSVKTLNPSASNLKKIYLSPGFIDTQINGYSSISFNEEKLKTEDVENIAGALWKEGVTTFFPTLITNDFEIIKQNLQTLEKSRVNSLIDHSMPGYFLEGPYISSEDGFRGAHLEQWVRKPDWDEFEMFNQAANHRIIQVGISPEYPGSLEFISNCIENNIVVSLAHHNGTTEEINNAVLRGARVSTHLGNGCANYIHRHENPIWGQLANDLLTPSIIADGHHLRKEELEVFYKVKGVENLMLVSDATKLAGLPPGEYEWNGKTVVMTEDGMLTYPEQNVLAGASFPITKGIETMVKYEVCNLSEAIQMATKTPARVYNLDNIGKLVPGTDADLVLFTFEEGKVDIKKTLVKGVVVYDRRN